MHPYFLQTNTWTDFWLKSVGNQHNIHFIEHQTDQIELSAYIYEYPWHLGKRFLYIPKGPIFRVQSEVSPEIIKKEYAKFLDKVIKLAKTNNITFIKLDFDYHFTNLLGIKGNDQLFNLVSTLIKHKINTTTKPLQYLSTMILDCSDLQDVPDISEHMSTNTLFWSKTNENIRRYTRKSLKQEWIIDTSTSKTNFEDFWQVYKTTSERQKFAIHPKSYFEAMLEHDFVRLIVLKDKNNIPHCCWFGLKIDEVLYYLYGGNDDYSFDHYGQYLIHLVATQIAAKEGVKRYDLGGYDNTKGFGKFKEGYRGEIVTFLGPIDIILEPFNYQVINNSIKMIKKFKK